MLDRISLRFAIVQGSFKDLPQEDLSIESLARRIPDDEFDRTYLHLAARWGTLHSIPGLNLSDPAMSIIDAQGLSVWETWRRHKKTTNSKAYNHLKSPSSAEGTRNHGQHASSANRDASSQFIVPKSNPLTQVQEQIIASINGDAPVPAHLNKEDLLRALPNDQCLTTLIHMAAAKGKIQQFPTKFLDSEVMLTRDANGRTPLHRSASRKTFHLIPPELLTRETLSAEDNDGISVIDLLIRKNLASLVPNSVLSTLPSFIEARLLEAVRNGESLPPEAQDIEFLSGMPRSFNFDGSWYHWFATEGMLGLLPENVILKDINRLRDSRERTPVHISIERFGVVDLPDAWSSFDSLLAVDETEQNAFHKLASLEKLGGAPPNFFTREALLTTESNRRSVADLIEEYGNTDLLPVNLRWLTRDRAIRELHRRFQNDFAGAFAFWRDSIAEIVSEDEFCDLRRKVVQAWAGDDDDWKLDDEQADAVAESGVHIQVTARAGSGKTRTLVARALFQIQHCRIPASSILILAFNKKAVEEIRERLSKVLSEEQMPHVLTFHALAYRIVLPQEQLIYDEGESKEGQVFSATIQRIIDGELRGGPLEEEFRELMGERWEADLSRILQQGYHLPQGQFLEFRARMPRLTMDGRRVKSEDDKHVGNALLRHRIVRYSYRRSLHRYSGASYVPDFSHFNKETNRRFVIEILREGRAVQNPARDAFWKSDRASNTVLIQIPEDACKDAEETSRLVTEDLGAHGFRLVPMSDDELWDAVKDRAIDDFTKAVKSFISRCQKELITPEGLVELIGQMSERCAEVQEKFWRLCAKIFSRYLTVLGEEKKTDFDQLMLTAAGLLGDGQTRFTSSRGEGDVRRVRHVLIDEFQDFSHLFNELRQAFSAHSPEALFFCVGDDWQAINKFAGSDLRYFTGFQETFQPSVRKLISRNYRSCRRIVETGNQVMTGHGERSIPNSTEQGRVLLVGPDAALNYSEAEEIVVEELGEQAVPLLRIVSEFISLGHEVAILSRTGTIATPEGMLQLEAWMARLREFLPQEHRALLKVSTTHGYKGKESDTVILLAPESYPLVHPNAIFSAIFGDTIETLRADEQRLFYVGVTRARSDLFLLPEQDSEIGSSSWIPFLAQTSVPTFSVRHLVARLVCGGRTVVRLSNIAGCPMNSGTYPIREQLKGTGFKWSDERKNWSQILEAGSINSPFECTQYLQRQAWIRDAAGIVATFTWEDQQHRLRIDRGTVVPDGSTPPLRDDPMSMGAPRNPTEARTSRTTTSPSPSLGELGHTTRLPSARALPPEGDADSAPKNESFAEKKQEPSWIEREEGSPPSVPLPTQLRPLSPPAQSAAATTGVFETRVAGMRYEGRMEKARHLTVGAFVRLEREPGNSYDRNAIQVLTPEGVRIGYVSRHVAAHLAPGLDAWGGASTAKVTSKWTQPPPHFHVAIHIAFPLPPGVVIPSEMDAKAHLEDNPFVDTRPLETADVTPPPHPNDQVEPRQPGAESPDDAQAHELAEPLQEIPPPDGTPQLSGDLTHAQEDALGDLMDPRLKGLITGLYLSGCCPWPYIGYEGLDSEGRCTDSFLEVAWPDFKIGIALPTDEVSRFRSTGWTILPAATVTASAIQRLFEAATETAPSPRQESTLQTQLPAAPIDERPSIGDFPTTDRRFQHGPFIDEDPDDEIPF